jgi:carboxypeptidase C (cathepsin A)
MVRRSLASFSIAASLLYFNFAAVAQEQRPPAAAAPAPAQPNADQHKDADKDNTPVPPEKPVATHHEMTLDGKSLKYTATAGNLIIRDEDEKPFGSLFYVGYTLDGADASTRPVSFLYNGGPGSATLWLHMGSFSPVRVHTDSPNPTAGPPFKLEPNEYSLFSSMRRSPATRAPWAKARRRISMAWMRTCAPSIGSSFAI